MYYCYEEANSLLKFGLVYAVVYDDEGVVMKYILFLSIYIYLSAANATFGPSPLVMCSPEEGYHGLKFDLNLTDRGLVGNLKREQTGGFGEIPYGSEVMKVSASKDENGICNIEIIQKEDIDNNNFKLEIKALNAGGRNRATLNMELDGKRLSDLDSKMICYLDQVFFVEQCKPSYDGSVYESKSKNATR